MHSHSQSRSPRIQIPKIVDSMRTMDQRYSLYPERIPRFYELIIELDWVFDVEHLQFKGIKTYQISNDHLIHYSSSSLVVIARKNVFCIVPSCQPSTTNIQQLSINIQINLCTMKGSKATSTKIIKHLCKHESMKMICLDRHLSLHLHRRLPSTVYISAMVT